MNGKRTKALKQEFFRREGMDYNKDTKKMLKLVASNHPKRRMRLPWRRFRKDVKMGVV